MATYTIEIDEKTKVGKGILALLRGLDVVVEKSKGKQHYNQDFVDKIRRAEKEKPEKINLNEVII